MLPFGKEKLTLYAYRHTYAQRHADAALTSRCCRSSWIIARSPRLRPTTASAPLRREAVDRVTAMQFDWHGNRVWRQAGVLLDSEHQRRAVGEVSVPYGGCSEPSNVAADGQDCPLRFRCIGCGHFRTDISYLPDLERYLATCCGTGRSCGRSWRPTSGPRPRPCPRMPRSPASAGPSAG